MSRAEVDKEMCGNCKHFDPYTVGKTPVGTTQLSSGEIIKEGYCRAPTGSPGLIFGVLDEQASCKQPPGTFEPIKKNSSNYLYRQGDSNP